MSSIAIKAAELVVKIKARLAAFRGLREFMDDYPFDEISMKALRGGREGGAYPFGEVGTYGGAAVLGASVSRRSYPRFLSLDDLVLYPPAFTPRRLEKMAELLREQSSRT